MDYKYAPPNASEFFTEKVLQSWNKLMPSMTLPPKAEDYLSKTLTFYRGNGFRLGE